MLLAPLAILFQLEPVPESLFVLFGIIINPMTLRAFEFDEIFL
jgi:hypothetical protein